MSTFPQWQRYEPTIWRKDDEKGWREQQEYRRRVWQDIVELEAICDEQAKKRAKP